jgi:transposase-like protein
MRTRRPCPAPIARSAFAGFRFPPDVIVLAVRWYLRFGLSYGDVEELLTDHAPVYSGALEELAPAAWHRTDQYANNRVEADHGRLKARLRPMRGFKQDRSARIVIAGHAFVQNVRRGYYELAVEEPVSRRVAVAFDELALAI